MGVIVVEDKDKQEVESAVPNLDVELQKADEQKEDASAPVAPFEPVKLNPEIFAAPQGSSTQKWIIIALLVVIIVGAAAFGAYWYFTQPKDTTDQVGSASTASPKATLTVGSLVAGVKVGLVGKEMDDSSKVVSYKQPSDAYWVRFTDESKVMGFSLGYSDGDKNTTDLKLVQKGLEQKGVNLVLDTSDVTSGDLTTYQGHYASSDIACTVANTTGGDIDTVQYTLDVMCTETANFKEIADGIRPIIKDSTEDYKTTLLSDLKVQDSAVKGYKTASMNMVGAIAFVGGAVKLSYQTPDEKWHDFQATQGVIECSEYNTDDLKNAFAGSECYNNATQKISKVVAAK